MIETFWASFREALQGGLILLLLISHSGLKERFPYLLSGAASGFLAGFFLSYIPAVDGAILNNERWTFIRYAAESAFFYSGLALALVNPRAIDEAREPNPPLPNVIAFALGAFIIFFEARALGFWVHDSGAMKEALAKTTAISLLAAAAGSGMILFAKKYFMMLPLSRAFIPPSLIIAAAALKLVTGGVGEAGEGSIFSGLEAGLQGFISQTVSMIQSLLMLKPHEFIDVPLNGLFVYLSGDRISTACLVVFLMAPPLSVLAMIFSRPDPVVRDIKIPAERRLRLAFFRAELIYKASPLILATAVILIAIHASGASLNPMYEPDPMPVRASGDNDKIIVIPLRPPMGDFSDGNVKKYVYFHGAQKIIFIAVIKPDGMLGVALDECEICKPAEWNKAAQGYAQRGENLVCKYCMTPIPITAINKPGGCNPIPLPFSIEHDAVVINIEDLVRVYKETKKLDKKGTHF